MARKNTPAKKNITTTPGQAKLPETSPINTTEKDIVPEVKETVKPAIKKPAAIKQEVKTTETVAVEVSAEVEKEEKVEKAIEKMVEKTSKKECKPEKPAVKSSVAIQFSGKNYLTCELKAKAVELWIAEGNNEDDLKEVAVYVNVDEAIAYYVINDTFASSFEI